MWNSDSDYAQRDTVAGTMARARAAAKNPQPAPPPGYRAPAPAPCEFRAAHAMLHLLDAGYDVDARFSAASPAHWSVKEAARILAGVRMALLPDDYRRSICAVNVSARWEVRA